MKIVLVALYDIHSIGIRTINALLKSDEHDTTAVFFKNHYSNEESTDTELADLADAINSQYADVLGFAVRSPFLPVFKRLLPLIENNPFILVGGHHATICPEDFIGLADAICVGEGEIPAVKICRRLEAGQSLDGIPNIVPSGKDGNRPTERLIQDLDSIPLPLYDEGDVYVHGDSGFDTEKKLSVITTRGCFFNCTYCYNHTYKKLCGGLGKYIRRRSVGSIIYQILLLKERFKNLQEITMSDSVFTHGKQWIDEFCKKFPSTGLKFRCFSHFKMFDEDVLVKLKNAGCSMITVGYQSGSEKLRCEIYRRPETNEDIIEGSKLLAKVGIPVRYDEIINCPFETDYDKEKNEELFNQLERPFTMRRFPLIHYPKSKLTEGLLKRGIITEKDVEGDASSAYKNLGVFTYYAD